MVDVFFVLNGLLNGEEGVKAVPAGGGDGRLSDGWYYLRPGDADGQGPYRSRDEAVRKAEWYAGMEKLDAGDIVKALLSGHLAPMSDGIRQGFLDAGPHALYGEVGEFSVIVDFADDGEVRCEAYLGDEAALVNLAEGTWERM